MHAHKQWYCYNLIYVFYCFTLKTTQWLMGEIIFIMRVSVINNAEACV